MCSAPASIHKVLAFFGVYGRGYIKNMTSTTQTIDFISQSLKNACLCKKKNKQEEFKLQCAIVDYLKYQKNLYKNFFFFAVPNGEKRDKGTAQKLKRSGTIAGVSDLVLLFKGGRTVFVELKTKQGYQSDEQKIFMSICQNLGFEYVIWRSLDDCIDFLKSTTRTP